MVYTLLIVVTIMGLLVAWLITALFTEQTKCQDRDIRLSIIREQSSYLYDNILTEGTDWIQYRKARVKSLKACIDYHTDEKNWYRA